MKLRCFLTAQLTPIVLSIAVLLPAVAWASEFDTYNTLELLRAQVDQQGEDIEKLLEELSKQRTEIQSLLDDAGNKAAEEGASGDGTVTPTQADSGGDLQADDSMDVVARVSRLEETLLGITSEREDFLESPSSQSTRIVNGRIHIDQWSFPDSSPSINVLETGSPDTDPLDRLIYRRIRFGVGGTVPPGNMSFRVQIEFSAEDGSTFRDAWIGWDDLAYLGTIRLGNQKRPYGLDHLNSSNFTIFMERPFIVDAVNENNRRFGLMSYGASAGQAFNWRFGVFDIDLIQNVGSTLNNNYPLELAGRLASTYWYDEISNGRGYGHLAVSSSFAFPNPLPPTGGAQDSRAVFRTRPESRSSQLWLNTERVTGCDAYQILGLESVINVGSLQCGGEFMNVWMQREDGYGDDTYMKGGYIYWSWFLTGEHHPWNRELGILGRVHPHEDFFSLRDCKHRIARGKGAWNVAARLSYGDLSDEDILGGRGRSVTFALNWYWNAHARLQWNYIFGRIDERELAQPDDTVVAGSYQVSGIRGILDF